MTQHHDPKIAFIGAGSVVFTQGLLADIFAFPELKGAHIALHDIDAERLATARGRGPDRGPAAARGAVPRITAHAERRAALEDADFVINIVQIGMGEATRTDFDVPARYGVRQTIGDTLGVGGIFRALRTFPLLRDSARTSPRCARDAWLLNYTNPMAMNVQYLTQATGLTRVVGPVPLGVLDRCATSRDLVSVPVRGDHLPGRRRQPPGVGAAVRARTAPTSTHAWTRSSREDEQLRRRVRVDMYRRLGYYPTETSEHSAEYVPWYLHHDSEIERLRLPVGAYLGIVEENVAAYERTRDSARRRRALAVEGTMEYAPQIIHSMVTGTPRTVYGNVAEPRPDRQSPGTRRASRCPAWSTHRACSPPASARCPPQWPR